MLGTVRGLLLAPPAAARAAAPSVSSLSVTSGLSVGGTKVGVHGTGFVKVRYVEFGSHKVRPLAVSSQRKLVVIAPKHASGAMDVRVVTAAGTSAKVVADRFSYVKAPTIALSSAPTGVLIGRRLVVTGSALAFPARTILRLQLLSDGKYKKVATTRLREPGGTFTLSYLPAKGHKLVVRVVSVASRSAPAAASRRWTVKRAAASSVTSSATPRTFLKGQAITVSGTASKVGGGVRVDLQQLAGSKWVTVKTGTTSSASGAYKFSMAETTGNHEFRVRVAATPATFSATSAKQTVQHAACPAMNKPSSPYAVWFTNAAANDGTPLSSKLTGLICAAAPKSTINVALYLLGTAGTQVGSMLNALRYAEVERGVTVNFLVDDMPDATTAGTIKSVAAWASHVYACDAGCANVRTTGADMHNKIVTISDMSWASGADPVVVLGSANWTDRQLNQYWQSDTLFYDNTKLYRDVVGHFGRLVQCATACRSQTVTVTDSTTALWAPVTFSDGPSGTSEQTWGLSGAPVFDGGQSSGLSYQFFPDVSTAADGTRDNPVVDNLGAVQCAPDGSSKVYVAMYFVTPNVTPIAQAVGALADEGCQINVLFSQGGGSSTSPAVINTFASESGVTPQCVDLMHTKFIVLQNVSVDGVSDQTEIIDGSPNWTPGGFYHNDEVQFTLNTATSGAAQAAQIGSLANSYVAEWNTINAHRLAACDVTK